MLAMLLMATTTHIKLQLALLFDITIILKAKHIRLANNKQAVIIKQLNIKVKVIKLPNTKFIKLIMVP